MSCVVAYSLRPYFTDMTNREFMEGQSYSILHFNETVNAQVNEVRVKYQASVMFGHATAEDVVKEMLSVLEKLAVPFRLMLSLGMARSSVNKSIMHKIKQSGKRKVINHCQVPTQLPNSYVSLQLSERYGSVWIQC